MIKILFFILILFLIFLIFLPNSNESFEQCEDYKQWHSCIRSRQGCEWVEEEHKCRAKCRDFSAKYCPKEYCHTAGRKCLEGKPAVF